MVNQELDHHSLADRQRQLDPVAPLVPAGPLAQGSGIATGSVGRRRFGQQLAHRVGGLLGQLLRQDQMGSRRWQGRWSGILLHSM